MLKLPPSLVLTLSVRVRGVLCVLQALHSIHGVDVSILGSASIICGNGTRTNTTVTFVQDMGDVPALLVVSSTLNGVRACLWPALVAVVDSPSGTCTDVEIGGSSWGTRRVPLRPAVSNVLALKAAIYVLTLSPFLCLGLCFGLCLNRQIRP